jgi:hypothetical protein
MVCRSRARIEGPFRWKGAFLKCFPVDSLVTTLPLSGLSGIVAIGVNLDLKVCEYHGSRLLESLIDRKEVVSSAFNFQGAANVSWCAICSPSAHPTSALVARAQGRHQRWPREGWSLMTEVLARNNTWRETLADATTIITRSIRSLSQTHAKLQSGDAAQSGID